MFRMGEGAYGVGGGQGGKATVIFYAKIGEFLKRGRRGKIIYSFGGGAGRLRVEVQ